MKYLSFLILFISPLIVFGQKENENYKTAADGLIRLLNEGKYNEIYDMYSPMLRRFQDAETSEKYMADAINKYGKVTKANFLKFQQNFGVYRLTGEKGEFLLRISLDEQRRLVALNISPAPKEKK